MIVCRRTIRTSGRLWQWALALLLTAGMTAGAAFVPATAMAGPVEVNAPKVPSFADVIAAVTPAVVSVRVQAKSSAGQANGSRNGPAAFLGENPIASLFEEMRNGVDPDGDIRPVAQGSGFFISGDGYVVTNDDVVSGGDSFQVVLNDGKMLDAKLVGEDARTDLAVLKVIKPKQSFTYVAFADDSKVRIGDWVVAVGDPNGLGGTVTAGIVSARGRDVGAAPYDDFIQFDAPVNRGDVGGPTFDLSGQVVGVNAALFQLGGGSMGVAYAVPSSTVKQVVDEIIKNGSVERGWLGVALQPVTRDIADSVGLSQAEGALVADVDANTPAATAGLKAGEIITSMNDKPVGAPRDLAAEVSALHPGQTVQLGVWHDGKTRTVSVKLGKMPTAQPPKPMAPARSSDDFSSSPLGKFGLRVVPAESGGGVVVTDVEPESSADQRGLRPGDVVLAVNGKAVKSADDVTSAIADAAKQGRRAVLFKLENGNQTRFVALPINMG